MFRKALLPILCAATFAAAIPLKVGESWVWQVSNRDNLDLTWRSAVVVDSQRIPEGNVWSLVARDSGLKESDTARVLVRPNGRQNWLRQSRFLGWELEPRRADDTDVVILDGDTSSVWGEASSLEPSQRAGRITASGRSRVSVDSNSVDWVDPPNSFTISPPELNRPNSHSVPLPIHAWNEIHGLEGALTFPRKGRGMDWRLVSHNGAAVIAPQDALNIPVVNTELLWFMTVVPKGSSEYNIDVIPTWRVDHFEKIHWKLLQRDPDSAGWKSASILQSRIAGSRSWSSFLDTADTTWKDSVVEKLQFRFHPGRGQSFGIPSDLPPLVEGWISRWENPSNGSPNGVTGLYWSSQNWSGNSSVGLEITREDGRSTRISRWDNSFFGTSSFSGTRYVNEPGQTAYLVRISPPGEVSIRSTNRILHVSLVEFTLDFPNTPLRWSTASGRTGTLTASEIVQRPAALRGKTVFLQARLPDGRTWQGTHVVP
ncbi:MAG TPA: hypothetical protein PKY05_06865 [Fibrobacteria bacterium]|nr:hypothetical protein [Fibrobacteria bacterium]